MTGQPVEPRPHETGQNPADTPLQPDPEPFDGTAEERREALSGSDVGSDTRAGSLQGGSATGSERDEAQAASDQYLNRLGRDMKAGPKTPG